MPATLLHFTHTCFTSCVLVYLSQDFLANQVGSLAVDLGYDFSKLFKVALHCGKILRLGSLFIFGAHSALQGRDFVLYLDFVLPSD